VEDKISKPCISDKLCTIPIGIDVQAFKRMHACLSRFLLCQKSSGKLLTMGYNRHQQKQNTEGFQVENAENFNLTYMLL
jgi:hypothetical protein